MSLLDAFIEDDLREPPAPVTAGGVIRREIRINIRIDGVPGPGTPDDPYNGGTDTMLDGLLGNQTLIVPNTTVRFGPGIFQTKGFGAAEPGFFPLSGQRFIGSGMYQTTLQLVKAAPNPITGVASVGIFSTNASVRDIEISDLTRISDGDWAGGRTQPRCGWRHFGRVTQGCSAQPWAVGRNPFGILPGVQIETASSFSERPRTCT